eukprot:scaffold21254_cov49-Phaeocystis_antarctica.AAC.2
MAWLWCDAMRWLLCPRCVRRPVLATCAFTLSRSRTWLCCRRCCSWGSMAARAAGGGRETDRQTDRQLGRKTHSSRGAALALH